MWKYNHTDELYHSLTNKNELYHSDTYLGADFSDGIRHFKYIDKIKLPSGKYKYVYDVKSNYNDAKGRYYKTSGDIKSVYGTYEKADGSTYEVKKSNKLFSSKTGYRFRLNKGPSTSHTVEERGLIRQGYDKVKNRIDKALAKIKAKRYLKKNPNMAKNVEKKVAKTISSLNGKTIKKQLKKKSKQAVKKFTGWNRN